MNLNEIRYCEICDNMVTFATCQDCGVLECIYCNDAYGCEA